VGGERVIKRDRLREWKREKGRSVARTWCCKDVVYLCVPDPRVHKLEQSEALCHPSHHISLPPVSISSLQKSLLRSFYYMLRDFAALAALYFVYPTVQAKYGLPGLFVWWNLAGREGGRMRGKRIGESHRAVLYVF